MSPLILLVWAVGLAAGLAAMLWDARKAFVVTLQGGQPAVRRGHPPRDFIRGCRDVARLYGLTRGTVYGIRTSSGLQLRFSRDIPARARQPLRNIWTPPPPGGGDGDRRRA